MQHELAGATRRLVDGVHTLHGNARILRPPAGHLHVLPSHRGQSEVVRCAGGIYKAPALRAEGDPHGGGDRGGVRPLLAAVLHHKHRKPGLHTPREQRDGRGVLFRGHPVVRQQLCQSAALRVPVRQLQAELPEGPVRAQGKWRGGWRSQCAADRENDDPRLLPDTSEQRLQWTRTGQPGTVTLKAQHTLFNEFVECLYW